MVGALAESQKCKCQLDRDDNLFVDCVDRAKERAEKQNKKKQREASSKMRATQRSMQSSEGRAKKRDRGWENSGLLSRSGPFSTASCLLMFTFRSEQSQQINSTSFSGSLFHYYCFLVVLLSSPRRRVSESSNSRSFVLRVAQEAPFFLLSLLKANVVRSNRL